jgi:hypothetical protein
MASRKLSSDTSLANSFKLSRGVASVARPSAPTIGTATDSGSGSISVTFTANTLGPTASSYTLTSSSGVTTSGSSSPLILQEIAIGTYTYSVYGTNANGNGPSSAASNSVTVTNTYSPSYESIATVTLGTAASSINFSSIPSTYQHLQLRIAGRGGRSLSIDNPIMTFNGDGTTSNYWNHSYHTDGATNYTSSDGTSYILMYTLAGGTSPSNVFGSLVVDILDYSNTNKNKTVKFLGGVDNNGTGLFSAGSGGWFVTTAINAIQLTLSTGASFQANTKASLYGIKG